MRRQAHSNKVPGHRPNPSFCTLQALALFEVQGVVEVVLGPGMTLVRLGRLFRWSAVQRDVVRALTLATGRP